MNAVELTDTLLDPQLLAATRGLALTARQLVAGAMAGLHASRRPGVAREFSQYRAYQPGDEPRRIDWKLFARSDRYFLRESEVDTRVTLSVVLDATGSMQHPSGAASATPKFELARAMAAGLAFLAENQGDDITLHVVSRGEVTSVTSAGHRQPFRRMIHALAKVKPEGRWPAAGMQLAHAFRRTELAAASSGPATTAHVTIVLTDGHEPGGEIRTALAALRARNHELLLFHFIAPDEREFPFRGPVRFEEWETGRTLEADATAVRASYLAAQQREREQWSRAWGADRFDYFAVMTDAAMAPALRKFLRRRARR